MDAKNNKGRRQRSRVRLQQNFVSLCCLLCVVFAVGWIIHSAGTKTAFFTSSDSSSQKAEEQASSSQSESSSQAGNESSVPGDSSSQPAPDSSSSASSQPADPNAHPYAQAKDTEDELDDALFIGDSRTVGLFNICDKPKATFYCSIGLNIQTVFETQAIALDNGNMGTVADALAQGHKFKRVFINFGTNEMGWPYYDNFIGLYKQLVDKVREYSPDAKIYVESILPVTASRDAQGDAINNTNVEKLNRYIKTFAEQNNCTYLQCDAAVKDKDGKLPEDASTDGIHMTIEYCKYWLNYIIDET